MNDIFKSSAYTKIYADIFGGNDFEIQYASAGHFTFIFDKHELYMNDRNSFDGSIFFSLNKKNEAFDMMSASSEILKGYKTIITVKPTLFNSDDNLQHLALKVRKCRFEKEIPENMTLFKNYSYSSCKFECMYNYSYNQCQCLPWDMLQHAAFDGKLCTSEGIDCFYIKMNNKTYMAESCYCLPDCNTLKFSYHEKQIPINVRHECSASKKSFFRLATYEVAKSMLPHDILKYNLRQIQEQGGIPNSPK